ncbi:MAG: hypothetical protein HY673_05690 [Chloroflexi bacterium]|nr:hypothetical protein [Chloroflexota bacterium]
MDYQELNKALVSKGQANEDRTGDHVFFFITVEGKSYRATKLSHSGKGQISSSLLGEISKQMRLTTPELRRFVDCTIEREQWFQLWLQRGASWKR